MHKKGIFKSLKNYFTAGVLSSSLILGNGCVGDIHVTGTEVRKLDYIASADTGNKREKDANSYKSVYSLVVSQDSDSIVANVKETRDKSVNIEQEKEIKEVYDTYDIGTQESLTTEPNKKAIGGGLLALIVGGLLCSIRGDKNIYGEESSPYAGLGTVAICGGLIAIGVGCCQGKPEPYFKAHNEFTYKPLRTEYKFDSTCVKQDLKDCPAPLVPVNISGNGGVLFDDKNPAKLFTDANGNISSKMTENIRYWNFTREGLESELKTELSLDVTAGYIDAFVKEVAGYGKESNIPVSLETAVSESDGKIGVYNLAETVKREIINDKKKIDVKGFCVEQSDINTVIEKWVDKYVNINVYPASIIARDKLSHARVENALVEIDASAVSPDKLVGVYFDGDLKNIALTKVRKYLSGRSEVLTDVRGTARFDIYLGTKTEFEITREGYQFFVGSNEFAAGKLEYTVNMIDKGGKVRVKPVNE
jgi:hypothetical protein